METVEGFKAIRSYISKFLCDCKKESREVNVDYAKLLVKVLMDKEKLTPREAAEIVMDIQLMEQYFQTMKFYSILAPEFPDYKFPFAEAATAVKIEYEKGEQHGNKN